MLQPEIMPSLSASYAARFVAVLALAIPIGACAGETEEEADASEDALIGGTETRARPEVGAFKTPRGLCTGTLVRSNVVITAAHCYDGADNGNVTGKGWIFEITVADGSTRAYAIDRAQSILRGSDFDGTESWRARDIALLHLRENVPASVARPAALARDWPFPGARASLFGYGCTQRGTRNGSGTKRTRAFTWSFGMAVGFSSTNNLCPGDSGGPLIHDSASAVMGINSGTPNNVDHFGNVPRARTELEAIIAGWSR